MWQKYRGKKLALFYLACLAGTGILYLLSYYVLSGYDRGALRLCHGFFGSLLIVLVMDLLLILQVAIVLKMLDFVKQKAINSNMLSAEGNPLDKYQNLYIIWMRGVFFMGCIVLIMGCMFS
ncbi:MAG: hypothetical protein ACTTJJ_08650 [Prevotella fusca]|uniref:hypothetical protein n=1 Tax=Prevotella fusca TaxID=589436 RepID=UPI003F9F6057